MPDFSDQLSPALLRKEGSFWFDTARRDVDSESSTGRLFTAPKRVLSAYTAPDVLPLLDQLEVETRRGNWVAGFLTYEAGYALEPTVFEPPSDGLLGSFGVYAEPTQVTSRGAASLLDGETAGRITAAGFGIGQGDYAARIDGIRKHIAAGDVYQINLTAPFHFQVEGHAFGLYAAIRDRQRVPYGAFLNLGNEQILSFSPELFFRTSQGKITTRPMKGTTSRSPASEDDDQLADSLFNDEKNRAENLMIVDLLRNDLSRISEVGSVHVPELFTIERYETVTQMTSTVVGTLKTEVGLAEIFRALFPCGSVTGAPKIRAMQRIRELESEARGVYCGAIGYAAPNGEAVFSVPIRTAMLEHISGGVMNGTLGVGSGVVWDSEARTEYEECLLKARFLADYSG